MNPWHPLPRVPILLGRQALILAECRGKRVIHLGCVDVGLTAERFDRNQMMHQKLAGVARELWGVDIDPGGIKFLREKGFTNLLTADICRLDQVADLKGQAFDVVVASEVVEHLNNPGLFLESAKCLLQPEISKLIITVPNAFRVSTLLSLLRGVEYVHPDHNYWFSYVTIRNLVQKNGYSIKAIYAYANQEHRLFPPKPIPAINPSVGYPNEIMPAPPKKTLIQRIIARLRSTPMRILLSFLYARTPFWGDGILVIAQLPGERYRPQGEESPG